MSALDSRTEAVAITADRHARGAPTPCACTHCGQQVPRGLIAADAATQFCCGGCEAAYTLIHSGGLDDYYRADEIPGNRPADATETDDIGLAEFDEAVAVLHCRPCIVGQRRHELIVSNIHCGSCVWLLERLPKLIPGVINSRLNLSRQSLSVTYQPEATDLRNIARTLARIGYPVRLAGRTTVVDVRKLEDRKFILRICVAGAISGNVMLLAFALYGGVFATMEPGFFAFFRWLSAGLGVLALAWPGAVFFKSAWQSVRSRSLNIDVPIVTGLLAGGVSGSLNVILGRSEIYFDSLTMLVFLLLVGRFIQHRQQRAALDSVNLLHSLTPRAARLVDGDSVRTVAVETLNPADTVEVLPGQNIPVDGVLLSAGNSTSPDAAAYLDEAILTGESRPREAHPGQSVRAGSVNLQNTIRIVATATGRETLAARLMELVEQAASSKPGIVSFADKVGRRFVIWVGVLAAATLTYWLIREPANPGRALDNATALLIVTCPCALGIAVPLVFAVSMGRAARRGILIKSGQVIERLAAHGTIIFDKTGTITRGTMAVVKQVGDAKAVQLAARVEAQVRHPIATAIATLEAPAVDCAAQPPIEHLNNTIGQGVTARIGAQRVLVGSPAMAGNAAFAWPEHLAKACAEVTSVGLTPVVIGVDGTVAAVIGVGDPVRDDAAAAVSSLARTGWTAEVLSGDHPSVVRHVAAGIGIAPEHARGGASPQDKLAAIREAQRSGSVVMVGDGVNDAAALAAADVGIAVAGGAEASLEAADVYMANPGLDQVVGLIQASQAAMRAVRWTLWASLAYNVVAAGLTVAGLIHPIAAAVMMPLSSLTVLTIAVRYPTFAPLPEPRLTERSTFDSPASGEITGAMA